MIEFKQTDNFKTQQYKDDKHSPGQGIVEEGGSLQLEMDLIRCETRNLIKLYEDLMIAVESYIYDI